MSTLRRASNRLSSRAISFAAGQPLSDIQTGFRFYARRLIETVGFPESRFEAESAVVVRAARRGFRSSRCRCGSASPTGGPPATTGRSWTACGSPARSPAPAWRCAKMSTVLVTGGTRGIGRAIVEALVAGTGSPWPSPGTAGEAAARAVEEASGGAARAFRLDLLDRGRPDDLVAEVEEALGPVAGLVNNAGIRRESLLALTSDADWDAVLDTNLGGLFRCCRAVLRGMMVRRRGAIVNVSSLSALHGVAGQSAYAASKAGILGLTRSLAREVGKRGVRVNAVVPGFVPTDLTAGRAAGGHRRPARRRVPAGRGAGRNRWPGRCCSCSPTAPPRSPARPSWSTPGRRREGPCPSTRRLAAPLAPPLPAGSWRSPSLLTLAALVPALALPHRHRPREPAARRRSRRPRTTASSCAPSAASRRSS